MKFYITQENFLLDKRAILLRKKGCVLLLLENYVCVGVSTGVQQLDSVCQNVVEKGGGGELLSSAQVKQDPTEGGG